MPENKELIKKKKNQVSEELDGRGEDEAPSRRAVRNLCVAVGRGQVLERAAMGWALLGMLKEPWLVGLLSLETCAVMGKGCGRAGGSCCAGDGTRAPRSESQAACKLLLGRVIPPGCGTDGSQQHI